MTTWRLPDSPPAPQDKLYLGLDLGQSDDYTALCLVSRTDATDGGRYEVIYLERAPLGTPYPLVVDRVKQLRNDPQAIRYRAMHVDGKRIPAPFKPDVVIDRTGVGMPVVDMAKAAGLSPIAVHITGGDQVTREGNVYRVPKRDLVGVLQVVFQTGRLKIASGLNFAPTLVGELQNFKIKINPVTAHDSYGAWREGTHDDLVLAVSLAVWWGERQAKVVYKQTKLTGF